jgi:hypothetical protein
MQLISYLLILHLIGDFLFQTNIMLKDKWWKHSEMFKHHMIYTLTLVTGLTLYPVVNFNFLNIIDYTILITMFHILSDSLSSWEIQRARIDQNFNKVILIQALDQTLHLIFLLYFIHLLT